MNDTYIDTVGEVFRDLDFKLRRRIRLNFIMPAVPYAILGADILVHYGLVVDLQNLRLIDLSTVSLLSR